jgi:hypothetical protein
MRITIIAADFNSAKEEVAEEKPVEEAPAVVEPAPVKKPSNGLFDDLF